jgi:hypothetical protein
MKKFILLVLGLLITLSGPACAQNGLNYTIYAGTGATPSRCTTCTKQLATGTLSILNYDWGGGLILNSGQYDRVLVRISGYILWPGSGSKTVQFYDRSDDGFHLTINNTVVINNWQEQGPSNYNGSGSITLQGGQYYPVEIWWYENGGGAVLQLNWNIGSGIVVIPSSAYYTASPVRPTSEQSSSILLRQQEMKSQNSGVYIDQMGTGNNVHIQQAAGTNLVRGINRVNAPLNGDYNNLTIVQNGKTQQRVDLAVTGNTNNITIYQGATNTGQTLSSDSGGHYTQTQTTGNGNTVNIVQNNQGGVNSGHHVENTINGSNNTVSITQTQDGAKSTFGNTQGNNNSVTIQQSGSGQHYVDHVSQGGLNNVSVVQSGNNSHAARIQATNNGGPVTVDLNQTNAASQSITIQQSCVVLAGCTVRITQ